MFMCWTHFLAFGVRHLHGGLGEGYCKSFSKFDVRSLRISQVVVNAQGRDPRTPYFMVKVIRQRPQTFFGYGL